MARLYKYYSIEDDKLQRLIDLLNTKEIYLSNGENFNDPFDIRITYRKTNKLKFVDKFRILCLTSSYSNKLMWSHYADSHKGVCVTIEVDDEFIFPAYYTRERVYDDSNLDVILSQTNKRKVKKNLDKPYAMSSKKKLGYVKDSTWAYENEYRVVFYDKERVQLINGERLKVKIHKVYLGNCIDAVKEKIIRDVCKINKIDVTKIKFDDSGYAIRVK